MASIAFHFLGCRLNEAENEKLARSFVEAGHVITQLENHPDVIILNTCGVTSEAMRKSRNLARRMAAHSPKLLVLSGCAIELMAAGENPLHDDELVQEAQKEVPGMSMKIVRILRNDRPHADQIILNAIDEMIAEHKVHEAEIEQAKASYQLRMRSFVKIQDGCNNKCTYCAVRHARGPEKSENEDDIIREIQKCLAIGEKEIVLTGVQLGAWHQDGRRLPDLIQAILDKTDVKRLRIGSIEPWHVRPELWSLWHDTRLCPHFHIPVQSGSDGVLTAMCRRTPIDGYLEKVRAIRETIPNVRISTDLIVGFPGETEAMWQETLEFIQKARFDEAHLFRFSPRPNTIAASLPNPVMPDVKRKRWNEAQTLIDSIRLEKLRSTVGMKGRVLWENISHRDGECDIWQGYSENYLKFMRPFKTNEIARGDVSEEIFNENDVQNNLQE